MPEAPWARPRGIPSVLDRWLASSWVKPCFSADETFSPSEGSYAPIPGVLAPGIVRALGERNVGLLYSHQARAIESAIGGRHVVVSTPTASGKSLCFHLPVLEALGRNPDARAIYLYPTKALARDQEASLRSLIKSSGIGWDDLRAVVYDGDTPADARRSARER